MMTTMTSRVTLAPVKALTSAKRANGARSGCVGATSMRRGASVVVRGQGAGASSMKARGDDAGANRAIAIGEDGAAAAMESFAEKMQYNATGKWRENLDLAGWAAEMRAIEKEYKSPEHYEGDVKHLKKILKLL